MKKSSFISVLRHVALFALIFVVSFALSAIIFIGESDLFCSFGIKTACKVSIISSDLNEIDFCSCGNGNMNFLGFLFAKDHEQQQKCIKNSCRYENPAACYYFAMDQRRSRMDVKDIFVSSCEKGPVVAACYAAGEELLKTGDKTHASEYFLKACERGHLRSCLMAASNSDSDEIFNKSTDVIKEKMLSYDNSFILNVGDKNGWTVKKEISPEQRLKILDNEFALLWPEAAVLFSHIGSSQKTLHYLERTVKYDKYDIYRILSDSRWNCKNEVCSSIVQETLNDIEAEISFYEKELTKIVPVTE